MKDIFLNSLCEAVNAGNYQFRYEVYFLITDDVQIPKHIREQYKQANNPVMMLSIRNDAYPDPEFDFDKQELSWYVEFNHVGYTVVVPSHAIISIVDSYQEEGISFHDLSQENAAPEATEQPAPKPVQAAPKAPAKQAPKKAELKLVVDNGPTEGKKSEAPLELVVDNGKKEPVRMFKEGVFKKDVDKGSEV